MKLILQALQQGAEVHPFHLLHLVQPEEEDHLQTRRPLDVACMMRRRKPKA